MTVGEELCQFGKTSIGGEILAKLVQVVVTLFIDEMRFYDWKSDTFSCNVSVYAEPIA